MDYVKHAGGPLGCRARRSRQGGRPASSRGGSSRTRSTTTGFRSGSRLRPDGVRHGCDHGRARPRRARLRVRKAFELPIKTVVAPADGEVPEDEAFVPHSDDEVLVDSAQFSAMTSPRRRRRSSSGSSPASAGRPAVSFRLRDWLLSRQRYWAARSRSSTATSAASCPCPRKTCRCSSPRSRSTCRRGARRSPPPRTGWRRPARSAAGRPGVRRTRWTPSSTRPGTTSATAIPGTTRRRSTAAWSTTGCPSTSTSAGSSTRSCISSTRASSRRSCTTSASSAFQEPFARLFNQGCSLPRREDVQVEGERRRPRRDGRALRRRGGAPLRPLHGAGRGDKEWQDAGIEGMFRFSAGSGASGSRWRKRALAEGEPEGPLVRKAHDDQEGLRRHRAALPVQHARSPRSPSSSTTSTR